MILFIFSAEKRTTVISSLYSSDGVMRDEDSWSNSLWLCTWGINYLLALLVERDHLWAHKKSRFPNPLLLLAVLQHALTLCTVSSLYHAERNWPSAEALWHRPGELCWKGLLLPQNTAEHIWVHVWVGWGFKTPLCFIMLTISLQLPPIQSITTTT